MADLVITVTNLVSLHKMQVIFDQVTTMFWRSLRGMAAKRNQSNNYTISHMYDTVRPKSVYVLQSDLSMFEKPLTVSYFRRSAMMLKLNEYTRTDTGSELLRHKLTHYRPFANIWRNFNNVSYAVMSFNTTGSR